ncbi:MAG: hypothetical protein HUN05_06480 [Desulfobacter sp.]|nr:MAG: hypothetical protein HUN05_06480 [Desulfobacter sp.]
MAADEGMAVLDQNRTLFVLPQDQSVPERHYTGAIDMDLGDEYKGVNLTVDGSILKNGQVRCQTLKVSGNVLGQVSAAKDIIVKGEIGSSKASEPAKIKAEGNILAGKTISNAIIMTGKSLKAPNADLKAVAVQAFEDIIVKNIFSTGPRPCVLQVGKAPNLRADSIMAMIEARTQKLDQLRCAQELQALETWFAEKTKIKEAYLSQHQYLNYVLALLEFKPLSGVSTLEDILGAVNQNPGKWPDLPLAPVNDHWDNAPFVQQLIHTAQTMDFNTLNAHVRAQADIKYGMYKGAVSADRRYTRKYDTEKNKLLQIVQKRKPKIEALKKTIEQLIIRKETFILSQAYRSQQVLPAVRVKNKTEKETIIKGRKAVLTVDQDIFGVKFTEEIKTCESPAQILIQGSGLRGLKVWFYFFLKHRGKKLI